MGNALRFLCGECLKPAKPSSTPQPLGPHGVTTSTVGVSALAHDILHFDVTSEVPDGLGNYVVSSKKAQANWYRKLSVAWKEAKPPPRSREDVAVLVIRTLKNHQRADVQGLLQFYALPHLESIGDAPDGATSSALPVNVKFAFDTLPVDVKSVADGDTVTVYVDTTEARESSLGVPMEVLQAKMRRSEARAVRDYKTADALHKEIVNAGFRVLPGPNNEEILARKYRIRLRGIDAPENSQPYGKESKEALAKLVVGKCLRILIYGEDRYGRSVGDIYCNGIFVQEMMLKKGHAWHYVAYDKRPEFAMWEKSARAARRGLWALSNPEKPWDYRRDQRNGA